MGKQYVHEHCREMKDRSVPRLHRSLRLRVLRRFAVPVRSPIADRGKPLGCACPAAWGVVPRPRRALRGGKIFSRSGSFLSGCLPATAFFFFWRWVETISPQHDALCTSLRGDPMIIQWLFLQGNGRAFVRGAMPFESVVQMPHAFSALFRSHFETY